MDDEWLVLPIQNFDNWKTDWDRLNHELCSDHPILAADFIGPAVDFFATGSERLAIWLKARKPIAMTLLARRNRAVWDNWKPSQVVIGPVLLPSDAIGLALRSLWPQLGFTACRLTFWHQDPWFSPFACKDGQQLCSEKSPYGDTIAVHTQGSFLDYWATRGPHFRNELNRRRRLMEREFQPIELKTVTDPGEMEEAVGRYADMEAAGWKGKAGSALQRNNAQGRFYTEVMRRFARRGRAWVFELRVPNVLLSSRLCIGNESGIIVNLKTTYDEKWRRLSPGNIQLYEVLRWAFEHPQVRLCDFYTKADEQKLKWATSVRRIFHCDVFRYPLAMQGKRVLNRLLRRPEKTTELLDQNNAQI